MKRINEDIKNNSYAHIYCLYGEESYLLQQMKNNLKEGIIGDDDINLAVFSEKTEPSEIIAACESPPFFSERKLVILDKTGILNPRVSKKDGESASSGTNSKKKKNELAEYIKKLPEYLYMIIVEDKADKRSAVLNAAMEAGYCAQIDKQSLGDIIKFITYRCKENNKTISREVAKEIIVRVGNDLNIISSEIDKLTAFALDKDEINMDDVDAVCRISIEDKVFDMLSAIVNADSKKAYERYRELLMLREAPSKIFQLLSRQFLGILQVKEARMLPQKIPSSELASSISPVGVMPFVISQYEKQALKFSTEDLKSLVSEFIETESLFKSGRMTDQSALELMIAKAITVCKNK